MWCYVVIVYFDLFCKMWLESHNEHDRKQWTSIGKTGGFAIIAEGETNPQKPARSWRWHVFASRRRVHVCHQHFWKATTWALYWMRKPWNHIGWTRSKMVSLEHANHSFLQQFWHATHVNQDVWKAFDVVDFTSLKWVWNNGEKTQSEKKIKKSMSSK